MNIANLSKAAFDLVNKLSGKLDGVSNGLASKITFFDNVDSLKNNKSLKVGDVAITSGFYQGKDGGGAMYQITNDTADGFFVHTLSSGLKATIVIQSLNTISIKQIGGRPQDLVNKYDNKPYIDAYLARLDALSNRSARFKLHIPSGIWCFSPTTLHRYRGFSVMGEFAFSHSGNGMEGTVINALDDNQDYVWRVGNGTAVMYGFEIGNLTFSASSYKASGSNLIRDTNYTINKSCFYIQGAGFGMVHPIVFTEMIGTAFDITSSWEITYKKLIFRGIGGFDKPVMNFSPLLSALSSYSPNLSNLTFEVLDFEVCAGHLINFEKGSYLLNSDFRTIVVEGAFKGADSVIYVTDPTYNDATATKLAVLNVQGELNGNTFGSIILNNIAWHLAIKNGTQYVYDTILKTDSNNTPVTLGIDQISIAGLKKDYNIILQTSASYSPNSQSKVYFGRIDNGVSDFKGIFNVKRFPSIKVGDMKYFNVNYDGEYLSPNVIPFYDLAYHVNKAGVSYSGTLSYDASTLNKLSLSLYVRKWASDEAGGVARFLNEAAKKITIRANIQNGMPVNFILKGLVSGQEVSKTVTLTGTGSYEWYDLLSSTDNTFDDMTYVSITSNTDKDAFLDVLRYN